MLNKIHSHLKERKNRPLVIILVLILLVLLIIIGMRIYAAMVLKKQTIADEAPIVSVIAAKQVKGNEKIILPGTVQAWHEATIYARTNGYIKKWYVDIGSHVKTDEFLAEIETPELDAQLRQAEADLNTAIANNNSAQSTAKRWLNLLKTDSVSKQEADERVSSAAALQAAVISSRANVDRLKDSVTVANPPRTPISNEFLVGANLTYEVDLWGRIRNTVEQSQDLAKASEADLAAVTLSLHAQLANNYFSLRGADEAQRILDTTVIAYQKALYLTKKRHQGGAAPIADVYEAQTQLDNAKTLAADTRLQRAQLEHAIAVLIGKFPADFSLPPGKLPKPKNHLNPDLPSTLLERRPDIAAAELRVQAANANIGIARAAFFPVISLSGIIGFDSKALSTLLSKPSLFWSLGPISALSVVQPTASQVLFDGGQRLGTLRQANASYFETVANYRQTVLTAFQEVEDNLVAIRRLAQENISQTSAAHAAIKSLEQAKNRYRGGITTFLDVVVVENTALQAELSAVTIRTRQQIATVQLVRALGGGWVVRTQARHPEPH